MALSCSKHMNFLFYTYTSGNIIKHNLRTSMNERNTFLIKYISRFILGKWPTVCCYLRERWRDIYLDRGLLLPISSSWSRRGQRLHPLASSSETPLVDCVSLPRLQFYALCLNLTGWFSSRDLLPVTHLLDLGALIVLSCLLSTT